MREELRELEGRHLTAVERSAAEEIGVRWNTEDIREEAKSENPYDQQNKEYWFWELNNICPKYSEQ
ncbi:hypothetical protein CMUS01_10621 [Colletotrichum musicola]|uniref:Uncharacterized protein n=1 Tax=Colletotrichum musicola TaxID=2175873 RepID=A0A8H6K392_9PEZI|nr:hypothetical protein CMUS01_10621 [Colletotrichum musicola]